ncbi:hypothetical protein V7S43_006119 [Phytophthora oleae]|uniref:Uncharacterized protein n=1 Tax=Phytophthora oleae TaxID=2107226 RepID=A0ABD3FQV2_9STRA
MVTLVCALVGAAESVFLVDVDKAKTGGTWLSTLTEDVEKLKKCDTTALIETLTKEDQKNQAEDLLKDHLTEIDPPLPRQVHVLVVVSGTTAPAQCLAATWKLADKPCRVLNFQESNHPVIHIPEEYAQGSGLRVGKGGLHLYLRSELKDEWTALNANVVKTYAVLWIVGPSGTGKSCAAFAFACSLKRDGD